MRKPWKRAVPGAVIALLVFVGGVSVAASPLEAQTDAPRARVIAFDEGYVGVTGYGGRFVAKVGSESTGASQLFAGTVTFPPGAEIGTHLHEVDEEVVYVLEGTVTVTLEEKEYTVGPGGMIFVPPGTWMAIANRTEAPALLLGVASRGDVERCFRALFAYDPKEQDETARREALGFCKMRTPAARSEGR